MLFEPARLRYHIGVPYSWRPLVVTLAFGGIDAALLGPRLGADDEAWAALGVVALVLAAVGVLLTTFEALVGFAWARIRRLWLRSALAGFVALGPAATFALVLSEGKGIQRSGWAPTVALVVTSGLVIFAATSPGLAGWAKTRPRGRGLLAIALGLGWIALTTLLAIYPVQYIRPHRGLLLIAALLGLWALWLATPKCPPARRLTFGGLGLLCGLGFGVFAVQRSDLDLALSTTFDATLVTQKMQGPLTAALLREEPLVAADGILEDVLGEAPKPLEPTPFSGRDVILFTGDTLRADRLMGPRAAEIAPALTAWEAFRFPRAATNHTLTAGAIPALLSARIHPRKDEIETWSETFRRAGYRTLAIFPERPHFRHLNSFDQHLRWPSDCMDGLKLVDEALAQVPENEPVLLWMHSIDAHEPHRFRAEDDRFGPGPHGTYDAAVHHFDRCFEGLRARLRRVGRWDRAVVAVTADHGESLGEHDRMLLHGGCHAAEVRIPLFIRLPSSSLPPASVDFWFQSIDLLPTLAHLVGAEPTSRGEGRDLSGLFSNPDSEHEGWALTMGEDARCSSLILDDWHLVHDERGQFSALHDLATDPAELDNVRAQHPAVLAKLERIRRELIKRSQPRRPAGR